MIMPVDKPIALVLSGGGIRAMAFHVGVLRYLAELEALEHVTRISSVSGGSLIMGLVLKCNNYRWPTSKEYLGEVYGRLQSDLCRRSMQWGAARQLLRPTNWRFLLSRANLLAGALRREWGIAANLSDLPASPEWSINGTTAENGRRFRFKHSGFGDYQYGYVQSGDFPLANALAVSAAFPGGFGPLSLKTEQFAWMKRPWDAPAGSEERVSLNHRILHLYDGGVYDNLGLESVFDAGRGRSKYPDHFIVVSDAGKPLSDGLAPGQLNPFRFTRVLDIMSDQSHALRVRTFIHYVQGDSERGSLLSMDDKSSTLDGDARSTAVNFPTTLRKLTKNDFDQLTRHGYNVARLRLADGTPS
ncbi:patatin-like phospholipase family protein [Dyella marensis]|uniref:NTE family protein n=1 Tax=Dyella marensis TaxID=500610 RepID=A0A1I1YDT6_9GAMM|nr:MULTISPECIES: patatin-like phospholipase family protein [Dyella]SFE17148.1 NTE family protein [Dyella marensis]